MTSTLPRLYDDLAPWWPLLSPPSDYEAPGKLLDWHPLEEVDFLVH
jgi:hypothetical protein